jgi:hypothetical protein
MPMLDLQRRHAEVFRLRLGDKNAKGFPQKLTDCIRVTSPNQGVVAAFVDVYGGDVKPWEQQWEAYLPTMALPVLVLPGQSITQWWESYKKTVCERRCDSVTEQLSGQPCMCPADIVERMATAGACRPMTRINIACPEVAVVGAGSLVTHGMIAAETLPQSVAIAEAALSRGLMVPAVLRVIVHEGKKHYVVPQLEIVGVSLAQLETGEVERPAVASAERPSLAPPAPRAIAAPSQPAQSAAPRRPAVAPPLPGEESTPPTPTATDEDRDRLAARIADLDERDREAIGAEWQEAKLPPLRHADLTKVHVAIAATMIDTVEVASFDRRRKHVNAKMGEVGIKTQDARHELMRHATDGRTESSKRLSRQDTDAIVAYCQRMADEDAKAAS